MEKILFPDPNERKRARLIQRDGVYYIQYAWNEAKQSYDKEFAPEIDYSLPDTCQKMEAYLSFSGTRDNVVIKELSQREDYRQYIKELKNKQEEKDNENREHTLSGMWAGCNGYA